jgi:hypothetical protein
MKKAHFTAACVASLTIAAFGAQAATNLVTNGSFETGDFTGWTTGGNFDLNTSVVTGAFYAYSGAEDGADYVALGPVGSDATLSQTFPDTSGETLAISFWLNAVGDDPSDFSATFDGTTLFSALDPSTGDVWEQFTFDVTGTGSDTLQFAFRDDPGWIALDNVSVAAVPEPAAWALMLTGFAGLGLALRRRTKLLRA